jgi:hypothetical protein
MRKIIVGAQVSMDGVMQAPGKPTEDPTKGFKFGGWVAARPTRFSRRIGRTTTKRHREALQGDQEVRGFALERVDTSWQGSVLLRDITVRSRSAAPRSILPANVRSPARSA